VVRQNLKSIKSLMLILSHCSNKMKPLLILILFFYFAISVKGQHSHLDSIIHSSGDSNNAVVSVDDSGRLVKSDSSALNPLISVISNGDSTSDNGEHGLSGFVSTYFLSKTGWIIIGLVIGVLLIYLLWRYNRRNKQN
jgi:hypothetical protein